VAARVLAATPMPCTENIHDQARNESPRNKRNSQEENVTKSIRRSVKMIEEARLK